MGGLVNTAMKGLAKEMQKTAAETRSVSDTAALRIQQSRQIQQRLGPVTVGPPFGQSMSTSNINGRVSKTINLMMPVLGAGGRPVAQAQVTQVEAAGGVQSCRVAVRATNYSLESCCCVPSGVQETALTWRHWQYYVLFCLDARAVR